MATTLATSLGALYEIDETAWLEAMSELIHQDRREDIDYPNLAEYLADMARRDRREVESRLIILLAHVLKWMQQADRRSGSWQATIIEQRQELQGLVGRGVLRRHAATKLEDCYSKALERAAAETGLPSTAFPVVCPFTLDELLSSAICD